MKNMKNMKYVLIIITTSMLLEMALAHPHDNVFWQFANWTAKQYTNESCYVCHHMPMAVEKTSLRPIPGNESSLSLAARVCISSFCLNDFQYYASNLTHNKFMNDTGVNTWCGHCTTLVTRLYCRKALGSEKFNQIAQGWSRKDKAIVPTFRVFTPPNYKYSYCFKGIGSVNVGSIHPDMCKVVFVSYSETGSCPEGNCSLIHPGPRGTLKVAINKHFLDWYWVCNKAVYTFLPANWSGICAPTQFRSAVTLVTQNPYGDQHHVRLKRNADDFPPPEHQLKTKSQKFWDAVFPHYGITQVWNQIEVTHYRLATFVNATEVAVEGIRRELTALRLTAVQNRLALDIILAEKGGVCAMVGDSCCTYVPANDDEHGKISNALEKMHAVATQLRNDEQGQFGWGLWYTIFGKWAPYLSMVVPVFIMLIILCLFGPCIFRLLQSFLYRYATDYAGYVPTTRVTTPYFPPPADVTV